MRTAVAFTFAITCCLAALAPAAARTQSEAKVSRDLTAHWKKEWPEQEVFHVARKSEQCEQAEIEVKGRRGKPKKVKTCLLMTDVYIARGYRLFIYRGTEAHYQGNKLISVRLGELQKAWKAGGVPAPTAEQLLEILRVKAAELGQNPQLQIVEMGRPRPFGEFYRFTVLVDLTFDRDGQPQKRSGVLATLQSDGGDWQPVEGLLF